MIQLMAKAGEGEKAEHWFSRLEQEGHLPALQCYRDVAHAWAKAGQSERTPIGNRAGKSLERE